MKFVVVLLLGLISAALASTAVDSRPVSPEQTQTPQYQQKPQEQPDQTPIPQGFGGDAPPASFHWTNYSPVSIIKQVANKFTTCISNVKNFFF